MKISHNGIEIEIEDKDGIPVVKINTNNLTELHVPCLHVIINDICVFDFSGGEYDYADYRWVNLTNG